MQLTMTKTTSGSRDGMRVETFEKGQAYAFNTQHEIELAQAFVEMGVAEEVKAKPADQQTNQSTGPDANKSQKPGENKGGNGQQANGEQK